MKIKYTLSAILTISFAISALADASERFDLCHVECNDTRYGSESQAYSCILVGTNKNNSSEIYEKFIEPVMSYQEGGGGYEWVVENGLMNEKTCSSLKAGVLLKLDEKLKDGSCLKINKQPKEFFTYVNTDVWVREGYKIIACGGVEKIK